ncbi:hypothetical protein RNI52_08765 [Labrys neptuniae]|uniref:O-methyltransferase n=1 Tax=Labrys neptuniae TaxID=376174 RepID=UPI00288F635C|nr:O-methyltransferase [Labrys neptuniae]MDT3377410.1 hypothetical protein [Labrys neptuniae]
MPSFDIVNYSLRPSKSIQRQVVFEGMRLLQLQLDLDSMNYIGFGSIWFTDFILAHKILGIDNMHSIEADDIGYTRAVYNAPYATVRVHHGLAGNVLPILLTDQALVSRPWMVWLDFDYAFDESVREDLRTLIENAPTNSVVLITFNGNEMKYGAGPDRPKRLQELFGSIVPDDLPKNACKEERMQATLADFGLDFMQSIAAEISRPGGFVPAFRLIYKDQSPMVTVGGILPAKGAAAVATNIVRHISWPGKPPKPIVAPHLTIREASALQSQLPRTDKLSRDLVKSLGFDLIDEQIEAFETYYRHYPSFAQVIS